MSVGNSPDMADRDTTTSTRNATVLCEVFRSPKKEGMYLYIDREEGLERVPEALLTVFGTPESALVFKLTVDRPLANASAPEVMAALSEQGFYLQMPPAETEAGAGDKSEGADSQC